MFFKQFYLGCLAHASYLIADRSSKAAIVVDPQRDIDQYEQEAAENGFRIKYVFLTHFHADFCSGHLELQHKYGAEIVMGARAQAEFKLLNFKDGQTLDLGPQVRIKVLETPGHTPESSCYVVYDLEKSQTSPHAVLTGDTLFVGDVGRPDLLASVGVSKEELASLLYDSLYGKLLELPDQTLVYPAHGAGSMCGKNLGKETFTTIGQQRQFNYALKFQDRASFVAAVTCDQPEAPAYFGYDAALNKKQHATMEQSMESALKPLPLEQVLNDKEAQLLDTRDASQFGQGFLRGSINIGLSGNYATWAGTILDASQPIIVICAPGKEKESAVRLARIGFDNVRGYLEGGIEAVESRPDLIEKLPRLSVKEMFDRVSSSAPPVILDVRTSVEYNDHRIDGGLLIPLNQLKRRIAEVPKGKPIVIYCRSGYRSMIAASILAAAGFEQLTDAVGGINAWMEESLPTVSSGPVPTSCSG